jgi:NAD(P)-dependent dehydrogenase (short-subunit alcohol dehydrogenase family)
MDQPTITLVSGGNKSLGFEIARGLARAGHHVLIGCRDAAQGDAAAATLLGEAVAIRLATLDDAGPTGGFFDDNGPVPW